MRIRHLFLTALLLCSILTCVSCDFGNRIFPTTPRRSPTDTETQTGPPVAPDSTETASQETEISPDPGDIIPDPEDMDDTSQDASHGPEDMAGGDKDPDKEDDHSDAATVNSDVPRPDGWSEATHGKKAKPNYDVVFDDNAVPRMDIVIAPSDWQAMMADTAEDYGPHGGSGCGSMISPTNINPFGSQGDRWDVWAEGNPIYIPCDITFKEKIWRHVGIRFKGDSSLAMTWQMGIFKLPFRLDFDEFEKQYPEIKNQRFYGFKKLALSSAFMDSSLSREKLTCDIFRAAGVPVGHAAFYRLFIDYGQGKKYFGLYTLQEIPAAPMLKTLFKDDKGNLYKPEGTGAAFEVWNEKAFDKETNKDAADFSDVRALFDALHNDRTDIEAFKAELESVFDVDGWLRCLAVNQVITNWDSYGRTPHNYFIYNDPGDNLIHWIPYDFNLSLGSASGMPPLSLELSASEASGDKWPLIRYIMDIPEYHAKYVKYVKMTIDTVFNPTRMQPIYTAAQNLIRPYVIGAEGEVSGYTHLINKNSFDREFNQLRTHVQNRYQATQQFLQKYQQELNEP